MDDLLDRVRALADDVLFESALRVDAEGRIPESHWERLIERYSRPRA